MKLQIYVVACNNLWMSQLLILILYIYELIYILDYNFWLHFILFLEIVPIFLLSLVKNTNFVLNSMLTYIISNH